MPEGSVFFTLSRGSVWSDLVLLHQLLAVQNDRDRFFDISLRAAATGWLPRRPFLNTESSPFS